MNQTEGQYNSIRQEVHDMIRFLRFISIIGMLAVLMAAASPALAATCVLLDDIGEYVLLPWNKCFVTILLREGRNLSAERDYPTC